MKTIFCHPHRSRPSQNGSTVIVIMALLSIMMLLAAVNTVTLNWMRSEVRLVEKRQKSHANAAPASASAQTAATTNTPSAK